MSRPRVRTAPLPTLRERSTDHPIAGPPVVRVATYRRASTDETNQPYTLDAQDTCLKAHIISQPGWVRVADFVERASGKNVDGRPELLKLLAAAERGEFDVVLVMKLDRWSRRLTDVMSTVEHLNEHGVAFKSATEPFDTGGALGRMMLQLLAMFAEFERALILDRIHLGIGAKLATGIPLTRRVGFGLSTLDNGVVTADEATIGTVLRMFDEYVHTELGTKAIGQRLDADGIPGPGNRGWSAASVSKVLRNRAFIGEVRHKDRWLPGAHDPLLPLELFDAAQVILDKRSTDTAAAATRRGDFVLSGTMRCGQCQGAYVGSSSVRKGKVWRYYGCGRARRWGAKQCTATILPATEIEELITAALLDCYSDSALFDEAIAAHLAAQFVQKEPLSQQLAAVNAAFAKQTQVRKRYQDDYEAGRLPAERYDHRAAELDAALDGLRDKAAELELSIAVAKVPSVPTPQEMAGLHALFSTALRTGDIAVRKVLFTALIETIEVHAVDDIRPTFRLYDPTDANTLANRAVVPSPRKELASNGSFASRRTTWR